jgi:hypothetical protein
VNSTSAELRGPDLAQDKLRLLIAESKAIAASLPVLPPERAPIAEGDDAELPF